ncbi:hypothetical protein PMAG_a0835 [Pseudoalteromonas mariniglutinosa NCIMB 1770]|nr:hypothetical protein [Pseudoalteromonas mariniglutinosa NCIMB 1770]
MFRFTNKVIKEELTVYWLSHFSLFLYLLWQYFVLLSVFRLNKREQMLAY